MKESHPAKDRESEKVRLPAVSETNSIFFPALASPFSRIENQEKIFNSLHAATAAVAAAENRFNHTAGSDYLCMITHLCPSRATQNPKAKPTYMPKDTDSTGGEQGQDAHRTESAAAKQQIFHPAVLLY